MSRKINVDEKPAAKEENGKETGGCEGKKSRTLVELVWGPIIISSMNKGGISSDDTNSIVPQDDEGTFLNDQLLKSKEKTPLN